MKKIIFAALIYLTSTMQLGRVYDAACRIDWFEKAMLRETAPKWNFLHIPDDVLPELREAGVADEQIRRMTVDNPRRIFESQGAY